MWRAAKYYPTCNMVGVVLFFSDKWNRFGTWQHLEINDPSQG